jgi:hypothetical protein
MRAEIVEDSVLDTDKGKADLRTQQATRLNGEEGHSFSVREWLLALIALVGLLLTGITNYFATIGTIDEVRIVVNELPQVRWGQYRQAMGLGTRDWRRLLDN